MLDYYSVAELFDSEDRQIQRSARDYLDRELMPNVAAWWESGEFPTRIIPELGEMGFLGANLSQEYGCPGVGNLAYGLIMYELERIDSGLRSFASVQGALVMYPISRYGSEEQKHELLPQMADGKLVGCFGLTEHDGGSDPGAMKTTAVRDGETYILNGTKMWITNGNIADIALVWAKDDEGTIRGFLVPTSANGFNANKIEGSSGVRPHVWARYGIAWGALGALESVYTDALRFSKSRSTFGRPIASRQLVQDKLVDMVTDHTKGLLLAWKLAKMKDAGTMAYNHVSVAKRENVRASLKAARTAREVLGGSGITLDYSVIRHMLNLETVDTYEGTRDIHTLIIGRDITDENALM